MTVRLDNLDPVDVRPIRRALISVYDKTRLIDLAKALVEAGVEIVSTGSTASTIAADGIPVTPVDEVTGFPEILEGRVKTLHPKIHAGILADQRKEEHRKALKDLDIAAFDLVVCNLYPFEETAASGASFDECVEQIDIGGPSMVRAAAKNHPSVAVVTDPADYDDVIEAVKGEGFSLEDRRGLAAAAFTHTALYDLAVSHWFTLQLDRDDLSDKVDDWFLSTVDDRFAQEGDVEGVDGPDGAQEDSIIPEFAGKVFELSNTLRYGENPHQEAGIYCALDYVKETDGGEGGASENAEDTPVLGVGIAGALQLHGKAMSYNNYTDGDAALRAAYDHDDPCVAIIKHANPCGIAIGDTVAQAHRKAHACDPVSAYGGVIAVNRPVSVELAEQINPIFTEVVLAPAYEDGALEILSKKKNRRVLEVHLPTRTPVDLDFRQISGGLLVQQRDQIDAPGDRPENWNLVSGEVADADTLRDLAFAWTTVRAVRSNAILLVKDGASVGVGMGQVNRVDSCTLAVERANTLGGRETGDAAADVTSAGGASAQEVLDQAPPKRSEGAVAASDAFFPFADGLQILIDAGVKAVVQPGGSIRDEEVIAAAKAAGITMYLTGTRHFAH